LYDLHPYNDYRNKPVFIIFFLKLFQMFKTYTTNIIIIINLLIIHFNPIFSQNATIRASDGIYEDRIKVDWTGQTQKSRFRVYRRIVTKKGTAKKIEITTQPIQENWYVDKASDLRADSKYEYSIKISEATEVEKWLGADVGYLKRNGNKYATPTETSNESLATLEKGKTFEANDVIIQSLFCPKAVSPPHKFNVEFSLQNQLNENFKGTVSFYIVIGFEKHFLTTKTMEIARNGLKKSVISLQVPSGVPVGSVQLQMNVLQDDKILATQLKKIMIE
jgi:hypothetical protein